MPKPHPHTGANVPQGCQWPGNHFLERPDAKQVQLDLFYDYRTNVELYPRWQAFLKERQPKTVIFWGQNDVFFSQPAVKPI